MWIREPGPGRGRMTHWQRSADASPHSRCAWTRAQGWPTSMTRSAGRSVSGRSAASRARSMPYFAISSAALAVRACASAAVTPASSALASSLRTRARSGSAAWEFMRCLRPGRMCDRTLPAGDDSFPPSASRPAPYRVRLSSRGFPSRVAPRHRSRGARAGAGPRPHPGATHAGRGAPSTLGPMAVQMAPSILSADFARLASEAEAVSGAADWLHVDVMDNHFVPNLTIGLPVVQSLLKHTGLPLDCHLMITDPDRWAPAYAEAGARNVTVHVEAARQPVRLLRMIRSAGARAGLAINPATPVEPYADLLPEIDMLLLMTVEPGFGGQPFLGLVLPKLRRARALVARHGGSVWLQVDGGVGPDTIERCAEAGADVFVAGSSVYSADDPATAVQALRAQAERATAHAAWGRQSG